MMSEFESEEALPQDAHEQAHPWLAQSVDNQREDRAETQGGLHDMVGQVKPLSEPKHSVGEYIRSIGRHYFNTLIVMMLLIGATYVTVLLALERHSLQQNISFLTSNQFIRFQQLANQARAIMRASADPKLPDYVIRPLRDDILQGINDIRANDHQLDVVNNEIGRNLLERLIPRDEASERLQRDLTARLDDFLEHAEKIADAGAAGAPTYKLSMIRR